MVLEIFQRRSLDHIVQILIEISEPLLAILPVSKYGRCHLSQSSHSHEHGQFAESRRNFVNIAPLRFGEEVARIHSSFTWVPLGRATLRFFRSADRHGAGPRKGAALRRRSSAFVMHREHAAQLPVAARLAPSRPPTLP